MFYVLLLLLPQSFYVFIQQAGPSSIPLVAITLTIVNTDKIVSIAMHQTDTGCPSFITMLVELRNRLLLCLHVSVLWHLTRGCYTNTTTIYFWMCIDMHGQTKRSKHASSFGSKSRKNWLLIEFAFDKLILPRLWNHCKDNRFANYQYKIVDNKVFSSIISHILHINIERR